MKKQRCKKGNVFPCKTRCVPRRHWKTGKEQRCRNTVEGTPATYMEWVKQQGGRKKAINTKRKAEGLDLLKSDKAGYLVNPNVKKGKFSKKSEEYKRKADQARAIAGKTKDPKTKKQALEVAAKFDKLSSALTVTPKQSSSDKNGDLLRDKNFRNAEFEDFDIPAKAFKSTVEAKKAYRELARKYHPDRGGSMEQMANLNVLFDQIIAGIEKSRQRKTGKGKPATSKATKSKPSAKDKASQKKDKLQEINEQLGKQADQELECLFG